MKAIALAAALALSAPHAHAESFFQIEAGMGIAHTKDMGDGTWVQQGSPGNSERVNTAAYVAGVTWPVWSSGRTDVRMHLDYTYIGTLKAAVDGVPDQYYDVKTHQDLPGCNCRYSPFNGQGHVQGISLTAEIGSTWDKYRFGLEAGSWVYWQTWHESLYDLNNQWDNLSHRTVPQIGYVLGASITNGNFSTALRYYSVAPRWNPYPGLSTGAIVLFSQYRF